MNSTLDVDPTGVDGLSFAECHLTCGEFATLWPAPRVFTKELKTAAINISKIGMADGPSGIVGDWLDEALGEQIEYLKRKLPFNGVK